MVGLLALGAGLGQGAQMLQQQQESALRQAMVQQQLDAIRRQMMDDALLGQVLSRGGQLPGFGRQMPINPLQTGMAPQAPMAQPPSPQPQAPQQQPLPLDLGGTPRPGDAIPLDAPPPQARTLTPEQMDQMERTPGQMTPEQTDQMYRGAGAAESRAGVPLSQPPQEPAGETQTRLPADTGDTVDYGGTGAPQTAPQTGINTPDEFSSYLGMFRQTDPSAIARHIKKVRPDADDGSVWRATAQLMKLSSGNMREQLAAASMMKFLVGEQNRNQRAGVRADVARERIAETAAGREQRGSQFQQKEARLSSQFDQRRLDRVEAEARKRGDQQSAQALRSMNQQYRALETRIRTIDNAITPSPGDKETRAQLQRQMDDLRARMEARMNAIDRVAPVPGGTAE